MRGMWLQADERKILARLFHLTQDGQTEVYRVQDFAKCFEPGYGKVTLRKYGDPQSVESKLNSENPDFVDRYFRNDERVRNATRRLAARDLISFDEHKHERNVIIVGLTLAGHDLGRKYSGWLNRSGLWFSEYKDHWFWLILALVGGGFVGGIVSNLADKVFEK